MLLFNLFNLYFLNFEFRFLILEIFLLQPLFKKTTQHNEQVLRCIIAIINVYNADFAELSFLS